MVTLVKSRLPISTSTYPPYSLSGLAEITLITPLTAFLPNKVPCGPLSTSILAGSKNPISPKDEVFTLCPFTDVTMAPTTAGPTP